MKVAFITPVPELERFATASDYHLVLAHICEQYPEYVEFYRERVKQGDYIILDNSAFELSRSVEVKVIRKYADIIEPSVVVLPDVLGDGTKTIHRTREAVAALKDKRWMLMGVPQGTDTGDKAKDFEAWVKCLEQMYEMPEIDAIGIYLNARHLFPPPARGRVELAEVLEQRKLVRKDKTYHMLGVAYPFEVYELSRFSWISGCDSVKPLVLGMHGVLLHPKRGLLSTCRPKRPEDYFGRSFDDFQAQCIRYNQQVVLSWAKTQHGPGLSDFFSKGCKA